MRFGSPSTHILWLNPPPLFADREKQGGVSQKSAGGPNFSLRRAFDQNRASWRPHKRRRRKKFEIEVRKTRFLLKIYRFWTVSNCKTPENPQNFPPPAADFWLTPPLFATRENKGGNQRIWVDVENNVVTSQQCVVKPV